MAEYIAQYERFLYDSNKHAIVDWLFYTKDKQKLWISVFQRNLKPFMDKSITVFSTHDMEQYRDNLIPFHMYDGIKITREKISFMEKVSGAWLHKSVELYYYPVSRFFVPNDYVVDAKVVDDFAEMFYDADRRLLNIVLNR